MKRMRVRGALFVCLLSALPAAGQHFGESFSSGWFGSPDTPGVSFTIEGVTGAQGAATLDVVNFSAGSPFLSQNNGSASGGFRYERGVTGNGQMWNSGDHQMVYLDYHMPVANGAYTFSASIDAQIYWTQQPQPFGRGYEFYMGDAASLAYGTQTPHNAPTGPWQGKNWNGGANTQGTLLLMGGNNVFWNGANQFDQTNPNPNGTWRSWNFTQTQSGNTINVISGEVIFRTVIRLKNADQLSPQYSSWAFDNLNIRLIPEPASAMLLALASVLLLRRARGWA